MTIENHGLVVLTIAYHSNKSLQALARDLFDQTKQPKKWIIVNNSPESAGSINLKGPFPISVIKGVEGAGFGEGCNRGFEELISQGWPGWVWLLNPDIRIKEKETIQLITASIETLPLTSIVGTAVLDSNGGLEKSAGWIDEGLDFRRRRVNNDLIKLNQKTLVPLDWISGCSMLLNLSSHKRQARFDPSFPLYYEDIDFCLRASSHGSSVIWIPFISVIHKKGEGSETSVARRIRLSSCSYIRFLQRYRPGLVLFLRTIRIIVNALFKLPFAPKLSIAAMQGCFEAYLNPIL